MKRSTTLALFIAIASFAHAQPVLTFTGNAPAPGSTRTLHYGPYVSPGGSGAIQNWDLSALTTDSTILIQHVQPGTTPNGASFPGSTVAETGAAATMFFRSASDGVYLVGSDADLVIPYTDQARYLPFPCTYQTNWTDDFASVFDSDGFNVFRSGTVDGTADGYGTVTMPFGTVDDVLRVHWHEETTDSTLLFTMQHTYDGYLYYVAGSSHPLAQLVSESVTFMGQTTTHNHAQWVADVSTQVPNDAVLPVASLYPVPTYDILNFNLPASFSGLPLISITDAQGRSVLERSMVQVDGRSGRADVSSLAPGTYHLTATDELGQRAARSFLVE